MGSCTEQANVGHGDPLEDGDEFIFIYVSKAPLY